MYRARDTKLDRDVALKVLPEAFTQDPDRLARFEREAKVLASLNHPNIAAIHGLEEADGIRALVLELVEGPTLADRIKRGPIPCGAKNQSTMIRQLRIGCSRSRIASQYAACPAFLIVTVAGWPNRHQEDLIDYLREENRVLREQLGGRALRLTDAQPRRLAVRGQKLGRRVVSQVAGEGQSR